VRKKKEKREEKRKEKREKRKEKREEKRKEKKREKRRREKREEKRKEKKREKRRKRENLIKERDEMRSKMTERFEEIAALPCRRLARTMSPFNEACWSCLSFCFRVFIGIRDGARIMEKRDHSNSLEKLCESLEIVGDNGIVLDGKR